VRVVVDDRAWTGRAVDLGGAVDPTAVVRAVRGEAVDAPVAVDCPSPGPVHDRLGHVRPEMAVDVRGGLAAAARSLGERSPRRDELAAARAELRDHEVPAVDADDARRRLAEAGTSEDRLRERVAALRGRLRATEEAGGDAAAVRAELTDAIRELTAVETERIAAEQRLDRLERRARDARDRRERRLALEDRVANLERAVRADLAAAVYDRFRAAVAALSAATGVDADAGPKPGAYEGDDVTAALAVLRVASVEAPVVVATDRLGDAASAAARLDAPVIRP
jgi:hypothetical protein